MELSKIFLSQIAANTTARDVSPLRRQLKLTQAQIAEILQVKPITVAAYEQGLRSPGHDTRDALVHLRLFAEAMALVRANPRWARREAAVWDALRAMGDRPEKRTVAANWLAAFELALGGYVEEIAAEYEAKIAGPRSRIARLDDEARWRGKAIKLAEDELDRIAETQQRYVDEEGQDTGERRAADLRANIAEWKARATECEALAAEAREGIAEVLGGDLVGD
jgi:transcriptional regulator with XRE-family HTH domain